MRLLAWPLLALTVLVYRKVLHENNTTIALTVPLAIIEARTLKLQEQTTNTKSQTFTAKGAGSAKKH